MPYILGALHFFEIQQYIRLPNRAFFLTYRQLKNYSVGHLFYEIVQLR